MEWLEEIDKELYELGCEENLIYYYQDTGKSLDRERLSNVSERRRELLLEPGLILKVKEAEKHRERLIRRKAELLERLIINANIEYDPVLFEIKNEINERQHQFDFSSIWETLSSSPDRKERRDAYLSQISHLEPIENLFRQFVTQANAISRRLGFSNYIEAKSYIEETDFEEITDFMNYAIKKTEKIWKEFIEYGKKNIKDTLQPYDIEYLTKQKLEKIEDKQFGQDEIINTLKDTLSLFGLKYSELPISIESHNVPYAGACYPIKVNKGIRLVVGKLRGYDSCKTLFHEFGHAIYYCFCPKNSEILIDNHLMREIMADIWKGMAETREWLEKISHLSPDSIEKIINNNDLHKALWTRPLIREYLFEIEIFKNKKEKFSDIWNKVTNEILFFTDKTGVYSDWDFEHPLDIKTYVLSTFIVDTIMNFIRGKFSHILQKDVFDFLVEKLYKPGNTINYKEKLKSVGYQFRD